MVWDYERFMGYERLDFTLGLKIKQTFLRYNLLSKYLRNGIMINPNGPCVQCVCKKQLLGIKNIKLILHSKLFTNAIITLNLNNLKSLGNYNFYKCFYLFRACSKYKVFQN